VEDALQAKAELTRRTRLTRLVAQPERGDAVGIFRRKVSVIEDAQAGSPKQEVLAAGNAVRSEDDNASCRSTSDLPSARVIRVLQQFLKDGKPVTIAITEILPDALDVFEGRMTEAGNRLLSQRFNESESMSHGGILLGRASRPVRNRQVNHRLGQIHVQRDVPVGVVLFGEGFEA